MKQASPTALPQGPMDSQTPPLCQGWHCLLSPCVPAPSTGQGLRRQQIQGLAQGSSGEEPNLIPDPQDGEFFCLLCECTNSPQIRRRRQRAGLARLPVSSLLPPPPSSSEFGRLESTSFRSAYLPETPSGVDRSSQKPGQAEETVTEAGAVPCRAPHGLEGARPRTPHQYLLRRPQGPARLEEPPRAPVRMGS